jgi:hypothetical protein
MYDQAIKYSFCLSNNQKQAHEAFLLLYSLEKYVNGAIIQANRIARTRKATWDRFHNIMRAAREGRTILTSRKEANSSTKLYCDYHFYFICIGQIHKIMYRLYRLLDNQNLDKVHDKFKRGFPQGIRDDLEHLDERAIGKKKKNSINVEDFSFGNFPGDKFSFGEEEYAVNKETVKALKDIYQEILDLLYEDYGMKNAEFVLQEHREKQQKVITKLIKRTQEQYRNANRQKG